MPDPHRPDAADLPPQPLDVLRFPLRGSRLIEASAGTGKTWTIAALYLRLVLGHGDEGCAPPRPLQPAEVLVMTFTRAATRELSDRIRARLADAARCFRGEQEPEAGDTVLQNLLDAVPAGSIARQEAAFRLASAAEAMDDAAVFTIDAWCQRMLREHAFDSGNLFEEELVADETLLREQAVRDHWRRAVYPLAPEPLGLVLSVWPEVEDLADDVRELLPKLDLVESVSHDVSDDTSLDALLQWYLAQLAPLKEGWVGRAQVMRIWLFEQLNSAANPYSGAKLKPETAAKVLDALDAWAAAPWLAQPEFPKASSKTTLAPRLRLTPVELDAALKKGKSATPPPEFHDYADLLDALAALPDIATLLRRHAVRAVAARMAELKARAGRYGFADMLERLDRALAGPRGEALRQRIITQYPVALVDEFQDTSPLQYRLFDRLYRTASNDPALGLFLIGDPKQSIYGFRGADIYSYLRARADTAGRHHVLPTNYRSTLKVVEAVNHIFQQAEQRGAANEAARGGPGAFGFGRSGALQLPFEPVQARGRDEVFVAGGQEWPALTLAAEEQTLPAAVLRRRFALHAVAQIVALLNDAQAGFDSPQGFRRLQPADIAVLVRSRTEADAVRRMLRERGVMSVFLSDQDTVLASAEAVDLLHWLRAVAEPRQPRLARVAYAGGAFGLPLPELARIARDDEAWDTLQERLVRLQRIWQRQGVLAMLRQTLHLFDLPARWLGPGGRGGDGGERRLTNVLHLAELLQSASHQLEGEQALIRWLAEQIHDHARGRAESAEDRIVRLESDAGLVQVITIHKSKGLEYPIVFMPFATSARVVTRRGRNFVEQIDEHGRRRLDFDLSDEAVAAADHERLREDLRLFYVALTRARHALWLGVGLPRAPGKGREGATTLHQCALGHLLGVGEVCEVGAVRPLLEELEAGCPQALRLQWLDAGGSAAFLSRRDQDAALQDAPDYTGRIDSGWSVGSFSALVRDMEGGMRWQAAQPMMLAAAAVAESGEPVPPVGRLLGDVLREEALREEGDDAQADLAPPASLATATGAASDPLATPIRHDFPRGALPGEFLHEQMETLAGMGFGRADSDEFAELLARRSKGRPYSERSGELAAWLQAVVTTPLPPLGAGLRDIGRHLSEMEFWLPSADLHATELDRLCRAHFWPGAPRPGLPARHLRGLLMGFADLVFEHGGRYWVLDYKSNFLGRTDAVYTPAAMQAAMLQHRYELQALLYQFALHRLLRARLGDAYDPAQQLGGAIYLFLRGIDGPARGCVHLPADVALLDALEVLLGPVEALE